MSKKSRGINAAVKLVKKRKQFRWKDAYFTRRALGLNKKADPLGGSHQGSAIVLSKVEIEAKQPNSALRKCVKCQLVKSGNKVTSFVPGDNAIKFIDEHDSVIIERIGGAKGRSKGDLSGIRYQVIKVNDQSLNALVRKKIEKGRR
jgi:small subunit ribosomal protein S12